MVWLQDLTLRHIQYESKYKYKYKYKYNYRYKYKYIYKWDMNFHGEALSQLRCTHYSRRQMRRQGLCCEALNESERRDAYDLCMKFNQSGRFHCLGLKNKCWGRHVITVISNRLKKDLEVQSLVQKALQTNMSCMTKDIQCCNTSKQKIWLKVGLSLQLLWFSGQLLRRTTGFSSHFETESNLPGCDTTIINLALCWIFTS